jgi:hypothetical protein
MCKESKKMDRTTLIAKQGFLFTNGEVYAKIVDLAENECPENWHEITETEYEEIRAKEQQEAQGE